MKENITIPELKVFLDEVLNGNDIEKLIELIVFIRYASQEKIARIRVRLEAESNANTKVKLLSAALLLTGMPEPDQVAAATQHVRDVLKVEPRNIAAINLLARLGGNFNVLLEEKDFFGQKKPDKINEQLAILFRQSIMIQRNFPAVQGILICLKNGVKANSIDFADGQIPTDKYELEANLLREVLQHNRNSTAVAQLGFQILKGEISGMDNDFEDGKIPPTASEQAGKLLRESLKITVKDVVVRALAKMIENGSLRAINNDFKDGIIPETPALQAAKFRQQYSIPVQTAATSASTATHSTDTATNIMRTLKRNRSVSPTQRTQMTTNSIAPLEPDLSGDIQSNFISTLQAVNQLRQLSSNPDNDAIEVRDSLKKLRKQTIESSQQFRTNFKSGI